jgi:hypothetical protein
MALFDSTTTDGALLAGFESRAIPATEWTHEAHLRIAWLLARDRPLDDAHIMFRVGLLKLNDSHGVPESPMRGYHETITRAWLAVVGGAAHRDAAPDSMTFLSRHPEFMDKKYLSRHYSPERLMSVAARARWTEPDREPLPAFA